MVRSAGIHHITAIAGEPKRHVAFYSRALGPRFVKRTVNFDDPTSWHLYYGDETGSPGSALTFFLWENAPQGKHGTGEAQEIAFAIPEGSVEFWKQRLLDKGVMAEESPIRFGETALAFSDPDGHKLELVASRVAATMPGWGGGEVPAEHAIRGFHGITLELRNTGRTARILTEVLGFELQGTEGNRQRFMAKEGPLGRVVDLRVTAALPYASQGIGSVHHVAFRATGDKDENDMRERALKMGLKATEQVQRVYFRSVYFREPGGVLFEIATDDPGFTADELKDQLGSGIMLPPWYEQHREKIEAALPPLE
jgi:glyoxalase family protein